MVRVVVERTRKREGIKKNEHLKIITMSWPDWFGFLIFNSVDWEMRERGTQRNGGSRKAQKKKEKKGEKLNRRE